MKSLRKAINDMCKACIYDSSPGNGNWRQQVTACTAPKCPLYPVRPVTKPKKRTSLIAQENDQIDPPTENDSD
jgi:hypothetical protein